MKNTILFIDKEAARQGVSMTEMAHRMGIDPGVFSKYRNGERSSVNHETLIKMQHGISDEPAIQAQILRAYLLDQCVGPASDKIHISTSSIREDEAEYKATDIYTKLGNEARNEGLDSSTVGTIRSLIRGLRKNRTLKKVLRALDSDG